MPIENLEKLATIEHGQAFNNEAIGHIEVELGTKLGSMVGCADLTPHYSEDFIRNSSFPIRGSYLSREIQLVSTCFFSMGGIAVTATSVPIIP